MPHVMWDLQGEMLPHYRKGASMKVIDRLELAKPAASPWPSTTPRSATGQLPGVDGRARAGPAQAAWRHRADFSGGLLVVAPLIPEKEFWKDISLSRATPFANSRLCPAVGIYRSGTTRLNEQALTHCSQAVQHAKQPISSPLVTGWKLRQPDFKSKSINIRNTIGSPCHDDLVFR